MRDMLADLAFTKQEVLSLYPVDFLGRHLDVKWLEDDLLEAIKIPCGEQLFAFFLEENIYEQKTLKRKPVPATLFISSNKKIYMILLLYSKYFYFYELIEASNQQGNMECNFMTRMFINTCDTSFFKDASGKYGYYVSHPAQYQKVKEISLSDILSLDDHELKEHVMKHINVFSTYRI
jgi:hypothetical protein